jgi:hypothetical protein
MFSYEAYSEIGAPVGIGICGAVAAATSLICARSEDMFLICNPGIGPQQI